MQGQACACTQLRCDCPWQLHAWSMEPRQGASVWDRCQHSRQHLAAAPLQFDGPKEAESTPISGSLRKKPTAAYARRLDLQAYRSLAA